MGDDAAKPQHTGIIKWFDRKKGFGFLAPETGGDDIFIHQLNIGNNSEVSVSSASVTNWPSPANARHRSLGREAFRSVRPALTDTPAGQAALPRRGRHHLLRHGRPQRTTNCDQRQAAAGQGAWRREAPQVARPQRQEGAG
tara:strand:+ start:173 stop:595 length:423 start_codon:yes stop_codon:yes gene_type:complete